MRTNHVTSFGFGDSSWLMVAGMATILGVVGCSKEKGETGQPVSKSPSQTVESKGASRDADHDLLMRVRFAGTAALMADTNAAYLTNIAALPETTALRKRIAERFASLPERLTKRGTRSPKDGTRTEPTAGSSAEGELAEGSPQPSTNSIEIVFADMLRDGFVLELRGGTNGVQSMALAASADPETTKRWSEALAGVSRDWFGETPVALTTGQGWGSGDGAIRFETTNGWITWVLSRQGEMAGPSPLALSPFHPTAQDVLEVKMASTLLPESIRKSAYGGFDRLHVTAVPTDRGFKIRGGATYLADLPKLGGVPVIPTNLVTDPLTSFTLVRHPRAWLASDSPLISFFPTPMPDTVWFWGGDSTPYQFFFAIPFEGVNRFSDEFGPVLVSKLERLAAATDSGPVVFDADQGSIRWGTVPFVAPQLSLKSFDGHQFLLAELFPTPNLAFGLPTTLIDRIASATNCVIFDWEFSEPRIDSWFHVGQLALVLANCKQLGQESASTKWLQAAAKLLPDGGNMFTEIVQVGPRELALDRLAPIGFSSIELFWLANWLESENFPATNFLVPMPPLVAPAEPDQLRKQNSLTEPAAGSD